MSEPESLTFLMGKHPAVLPADRRYCRNHMWALTVGDGRWRFGFTAYAMRLMKDVYFLDWCVNVGDSVALKQKVGNIETSKAVSDLFAPVAGTVTDINQAALTDPSIINVENYAGGWLFELGCSPDGTLDVHAYHDFLAAGWENTQRMLKGQM
jgi:glycine cleavage system H protein